MLNIIYPNIIYVIIVLTVIYLIYIDILCNNKKSINASTSIKIRIAFTSILCTLNIVTGIFEIVLERQFIVEIICAILWGISTAIDIGEIWKR